MTARRRLTIAFVLVSLFVSSRGLVPIGPTAGSRDDSALEFPSDAATRDGLDAARVLSRLHTGLAADEIARVGVAVVLESQRAGIPAELVLALIQVESSGNAFAVSPVGAMGLMQLLPSTAEEVAADLGIQWTGAPMLFDPVANVRLGVEYLRQLIDRYDDVSTALAAYNWGPGRIGEKLRAGETIPVGYANKVLARYRRPVSNAI